MKGIDGRTIAHITCFKCNRNGHYSDNCPENIRNENETEGETGTQHMQEGERNEVEEDLEEGVTQLMNGEEIGTEGINGYDDECDSDDGSIVMNF